MEIEIIQMIFLFFKTCAMFIKNLFFFDRKKSFDVLK